MNSKILSASVFVGLLALGAAAYAAAPDDEKEPNVVADMYLITPDGDGAQIGTVTMHDSGAGLVLITNLTGLPPGTHGIHVHENPECDPGTQDGKKVAGLAAGGHYDPDHTGKHMGPAGNGHKGDLPVLTVDKSGKADDVLVAPHLKLADVRERSIIIHEGGDNYSDAPAPLGGGGKRIACAVVY